MTGFERRRVLSNDSALPKRPVVQVAPEIEPARPLPELSAALLPLASSKPYAATRPAPWAWALTAEPRCVPTTSSPARNVERDGVRVAAGEPRGFGRDRREYHIHCLLPHQQRPTHLQFDLLRHGGVDSGPLHALANDAGAGNGVYRYGTSSFPTETFNATNYWVDVVFQP